MSIRSDMIAQTLAIARGEIGTQEAPAHDNTGARVEEYQRAAGYSFPVPWCLCFAFYCVDQAAKRDQQPTQLLRTGDCDTVAVWARQHGCLYDSPQAGDIGLLYKAPGVDAHHAFLVAGVSGTSVSTIEGNTNTDGSAEGYEVCARTRAVNSRTRFVRWADLYEDAAPVTYRVIAPNGATLVPNAPVVGGKVIVPVKEALLAMGVQPGAISWDADEQGVRVAGGPTSGGLIAPVTLIGGKSWAPVRDVAAVAGGDVLARPADHVAVLVKSAGKG